MICSPFLYHNEIHERYEQPQKKERKKNVRLYVRRYHTRTVEI